MRHKALTDEDMNYPALDTIIVKRADWDALVARVAEAENALAEMTGEQNAWKARWRHDSTDTYNARINAALRTMTVQP